MRVYVMKNALVNTNILVQLNDFGVCGDISRLDLQCRKLDKYLLMSIIYNGSSKDQIYLATKY